MTKALLILLDYALSDAKGKGRKANVALVVLITLSGATLWNTRNIPEQMSALNMRVARIEWRLNVTDQAVTGPGPVTPAASPFPLGQDPLPSSNSPFAFYHK